MLINTGSHSKSTSLGGREKGKGVSDKIDKVDIGEGGAAKNMMLIIHIFSAFIFYATQVFHLLVRWSKQRYKHAQEAIFSFDIVPLFGNMGGMLLNVDLFEKVSAPIR